MHYIWGLEARIFRENGNVEISKKICSEIDRHWLIPNSIFNTPEKMQEFETKRRERFTYDGVIEKEKIAFYESENNKKNANTLRLIALKNMVLFNEIGVFPGIELNKEQVENDIKEYITELSKTK